MSLTVKDRLEVLKQLELSLKVAYSKENIPLPKEVEKDLDFIFDKIDVASTGYTNLITCVSCTAVDNTVDPRFHRQPRGSMPSPENKDGWFSGRTISEQVIYPWMEMKNFRTSKSGWQTRTFERPQPYTLKYPENIGHIKMPFLRVLDYVNKNRSKANSIISYLLRKEIEASESKIKTKGMLAKHKTDDDILIVDIIDKIEKHFSFPNSAHLPVVAVHTIYEVILNLVSTYSDKVLRDLESHQASDLRTGSIGDIELEDIDGDVVEGIEVKHNVPIDITILLKAKEKIEKSNVKRYYILTTHRNCTSIDNQTLRLIRDIYHNHGCQVIVNGVLPTIKYYLRMAPKPAEFLDRYTSKLISLDSVTSQQLEEWNKILEI